mgnify:CR=1 FL=1
MVLRPPLPAANAQTATIGAAVAVCRAVQMLCGLELAIKWVNDLYYKGKKVCGILTEAGTDLESGQLEWLVVGIGLNLTATAEDFPGACRQSRQPIPRRPCPGKPGGAGRCHRAGAVGALPGLCLSGRVPRPLLCARSLGDRVHRHRDLRRTGAFH